jgi:nucleoside-diphosphate-sugar epimerase
MNVLITACNGFIGRALINRLPPDCNIIELGPHPFPTPDLPNIRSEKKQISDLTRDDVAAFFNGEKFAAVHLAWHSPRESSFAIAAARVREMAHFLDVSMDYLSHFVSLGSADEFGNAEGKLAPDASCSGMVSPYGWSKRSAAALLFSLGSRRETASFWLRPFTVYGEHQHGSMMLPYALAKASARQDAYFSDGIQQRDFIHVDDVVEAIWLAINRDTIGFHMLNLGWGEPVEVRKVILEIARRMDVEAFFHLGSINRRIDEPLIRYADVAATHASLNWAPRITLHEGLDRIINAGVHNKLFAHSASRVRTGRGG